MSSLTPIDADATLAERILRQASELFADRGWAATSLREIAEAAGCTKPALYYHWGNKEALFIACIRAETEALTALIAEQLDDDAGETSIGAKLVGGLREFFAHLERSPKRMRLLMRAELRPEPEQPVFDFVSLRDQHHDYIRTLLARAVERGELRSDVDLADMAHALSGMVDQRVQLWLHGEPLDANLPERIVHLFLHGVGTS
jgi:AcrR family transcriptional regulator